MKAGIRAGMSRQNSRLLQNLRGLSRHDRGFTLIELLVVIIIIGILAAIAIPVFLSQRAKGYDASVKNDLRNGAIMQDTYLTQSLTTYTTALVTNGLKVSPNNTITVGFNTGARFCIVGTNSNSSKYFLFDSGTGGLSATTYTSLSAAEAPCASGANPIAASAFATAS